MCNMNITFLGTACMTHTKERNQSGIFLKYKGEGVLFDCGEGIQRQMKIAGIKLTDVTKILISHWHGDHVLGLPGLIQSLAASEYAQTLEVYGPKNIQNQIRGVLQAFGVQKPPIPLRIQEVGDGLFFENNDFFLSSASLEHSVPCVGYSFQEQDRRRIRLDIVKKIGIPEGPLLGELQEGKDIEWKGKKVKCEETTTVVKGRKLTVIVDTVATRNCIVLAKNADLLICEATYSSKEKDKAKQYKHLTAKESAQIAAKSSVEKLILTHFSQRYKNTQEIEEDARTVFNNVICAYDFMRVTL